MSLGLRLEHEYEVGQRKNKVELTNKLRSWRGLTKPESVLAALYSARTRVREVGLLEGQLKQACTLSFVQL